MLGVTESGERARGVPTRTMYGNPRARRSPQHGAPRERAFLRLDEPPPEPGKGHRRAGTLRVVGRAHDVERRREAGLRIREAGDEGGL
eukprot:1348031-Prymnesium_polylepis.1